MGLFDNLDDETPPPLAVIRSFLALAIQIGAPAYNAGDRRGCYEVYACVARLLVRTVKGADPATRVLAEALEACALEVDVNDQAWIMRRAFDKLLLPTDEN
jgi:hypothetical protein